MVKQLSLFSQPTLNVNLVLKEKMAICVKNSGLSRDDVLGRMNVLADRYGVRLNRGAGKQLNMATFEKWLNPTAMEHVPPVNSLVIFCAAIGDNSCLAVLANPLGAQLIEEPDVTLLQWAQEYQRAKLARKNMKKLEADL